MPLERWQVKLEFERAGGKAARMRRWGGLIRGGKAAEGRRTPRRWRVNRWLPNHAKRLGVRQSSGASGRRADDSQQDQECAENGTQQDDQSNPATTTVEKRRRAAALQDAGALTDGFRTTRSVLECASPLALWEGGRMIHSRIRSVPKPHTGRAGQPAKTTVEKRRRAAALQDAGALTDGSRTTRSVLECASPLALREGGRMIQSRIRRVPKTAHRTSGTTGHHHGCRSPRSRPRVNPLPTAADEVETRDGAGLVLLVVFFIGRLYHQRVIASAVCLFI